MDEELKQLASLALKNAFYDDFSALVNAYIKAAEGLGDDTFEMQLCETANVFSRDDKAEGDIRLHIWTQNGSRFASSQHDTVLEALELDRATEVHLQGHRVFERRDGEWYFVGDEGE